MEEENSSIQVKEDTSPSIIKIQGNKIAPIAEAPVVVIHEEVDNQAPVAVAVGNAPNEI